jgi:hypothetical protein
MNLGMVKLTIGNARELEELLKRGDTDALYKRLDTLGKMKINSHRAIKKYLNKEGFSYDRDPMDAIYPKASDVLKAFIDTEDMIHEVMLYLEYECGYTVF